ncbi:uncharacterized protein LOC133806584 [Humulus lupulus]|uniref:uncharacterized protein LOC133806584 n=1 Tax=Humulus lupulus TaxID=3486 RepID=UPI002B410E86|nr:uncharacterized protein LOC133806584 [Humulus lupulus]
MSTYGGTLLSACAQDAGATVYTEKKFKYHMKELDNLDKRIRSYLQKIGYHKWSRFYSQKKRKLAQKTMTRLTPVAEQALTNNFVYSLRLTVKPENEYLFEVFKEDKSWIVNLKERICTCNRFQNDEFPCGHALAVMKEMNIDPYDYCSHYYTTKVWLETYNAIVYPVGKQQH